MFYWLAVVPILYLAFKYIHFFKYFGANVWERYPIVRSVVGKIYYYLSTFNIWERYSIVREIYRYLSIVTIFEFIRFRLRQIASRNLEIGLLKVKNNVYELTYYNDSLKYIAVWPKRRGPCPFSQVMANNLFLIDDVTEQVRMYAGPSHNFHGIQTTPFMLGYEDLIFTLRNGKTLYFRGTDFICLDVPLPVA